MVNMSLRILSKPSEDKLADIFKVRHAHLYTGASVGTRSHPPFGSALCFGVMASWS
jgi:hypothetical protein